MSLNDADVREILRVIDTSGAREIKVQTRGFALHVIRDTAGSGAGDGSASGGALATAAGAAAVPVSEPTLPTDADQGLVAINSPMLGTFYRAESPGEPPFVEVGSSVEPDSIVCIIEVMKMMNSVPAGVAGTIVEICHENAKLVEYGAPLFRIEPA
jgi:acetyl-CoA carboxylase biotin carboxyl carrier protein